jgi:phosphoribosylamine---glycine ligase
VRVLVVGSGGREHALAEALAAGDVHASPGNPGIAEIAECHDVAATDVAGITDLAGRVAPDLVVVGPEAPLVAGLADSLRQAGIPVFGPGRDAARLEGSKAFAKEILAAADVPTARSATVTTIDDARRAIESLGDESVVKADGLAAGKGVVVCDSTGQAIEAVAAMIGGGRLVIEERLEGFEVSLLAICDGDRTAALPPAQDFKRIGDGDTGPNTGGMGAFSPVPAVSADEAEQLVERVHRPVLRELGRRGIRFSGCLYAGLMMTPAGPRVLEFNVRFGDPETQPLLARLDEDLGEILLAAATGGLQSGPVRVTPGAAVTVVLASRGYPLSSESGVTIAGIEDALATGARVHHAGTARRDDGALVTAGGRVLGVTATGGDIAAARDAAYRAADLIRFDGMQRREDVAAAAAGVGTGA